MCVCVSLLLHPLKLLPLYPSFLPFDLSLFHSSFLLSYSYHQTITLFTLSSNLTPPLPRPLLAFSPSLSLPLFHYLYSPSFLQGNYDNFKEQEAVKQHQQQKLWEKQEKKLREMKGKGVSKENAEKAQLKAKAREPGKRLAPSFF